MGNLKKELSMSFHFFFSSKKYAYFWCWLWNNDIFVGISITLAFHTKRLQGVVFWTRPQKQRPLSPHIEHDKDPSLLKGIKRWAKALILLLYAGNGMSTFSSWALNTIKVTTVESGMASYLKYFFTNDEKIK